MTFFFQKYVWFAALKVWIARLSDTTQEWVTHHLHSSKMCHANTVQVALFRPSYVTFQQVHLVPLGY